MKRVSKPLPSVCADCKTTIHAIRNPLKDYTADQRWVWVHDATLSTTVRKGGSHNATPDPSYPLTRARMVSFPFSPGRADSSVFDVQADLLRDGVVFASMLT